MQSFDITTDAATIAVFDLEALRHRIDDDGDWWTSPLFPELQAELGGHNLYLIDTRADGTFHAKVVQNDRMNDGAYLNTPSRSVYIVSGEEIPGEGLIPECLRGGIELRIDSDCLHVKHTLSGSDVTIEIQTSGPQ